LDGGQWLTIEGVGFNGTDASVTVDGVDCKIIDRTTTTITCVTGAASAESFTDRLSPGQPGLEQRAYKKANGGNVGWADFVDANKKQQQLYTSFETYDSLAGNYRTG